MDINEIARLAGVSRATVSRFLNDGYVSKEKRRLIAKVIRETGYVPSQPAQQLRTGKTHLVGVIIPKINSYSVARMVQGITESLASAGYQVLLANTDNNEATEIDYLRIFSARNRVDGIILIGTVLTDEHFTVIDSVGVPVVVLGQEVQGRSCVFHDDFRAMRDLTRSIIATAKVPAYIGVTERDVAAGEKRHRGFLLACEEAGIEVRPEAQVAGDFSMDSGYLLCEQLLDTVPDVDTIVCATDDIAVGALACLREYNHSVPDEVQVAGIGDSMLSRVISPSLTTVRLAYGASGSEAAMMLLAAMVEEDTLPRELRMGYEVFARMSTR